MKIIFDNEEDKETFMNRICPSHILDDPIEICRYGSSARYGPNGEDQCPECYRSCGIEIDILA